LGGGTGRTSGGGDQKKKCPPFTGGKYSNYESMHFGTRKYLEVGEKCMLGFWSKIKKITGKKAHSRDAKMKSEGVPKRKDAKKKE